MTDYQRQVQELAYLSLTTTETWLKATRSTHSEQLGSVMIGHCVSSDFEQLITVGKYLRRTASRWYVLYTRLTAQRVRDAAKSSQSELLCYFPFATCVSSL